MTITLEKPVVSPQGSLTHSCTSQCPVPCDIARKEFVLPEPVLPVSPVMDGSSV